MDELAVVYVRRVLMIFPHADNKKQRQGWMLAPRVIGDSPWDRGRGHDTNLDAYPRDMEGETAQQQASSPVVTPRTIPWVYLALFDGHAGSGVAVASANTLHRIIQEKLENVVDLLLPPPPTANGPGDSGGAGDCPMPTPASLLVCPRPSVESLVTGALEAAFHDMDLLIEYDKRQYRMSGGCTVLVAVFILGKLYLANAGDSRAIICKGKTVVPMSCDFTPESERSRVKQLGFLRPELLGDEFTRLEFIRRPTRKDIGKNLLYRDSYMTGWAYKMITIEDLKFPLVFGEGKRFEAVPNMEADAFAADSNMSTDAAPPYPWSGTLAEVYQLGIEEKISHKTNIGLFADDIILWSSNTNWKKAERDLNKTLLHLEKFANKHKLEFNPQKSETCLFTTDKKLYKIRPKIILKEQQLQYNKHPKYLGYTLDPEINSSKHIEEVIRKGRDRLKILKYISGREWGADATTLKLTYTSLIRPILEYGYQIYGTASETNLKSLERIQLSAARIITGLRNTCPNDIVLYEADIMPLKDRRSYNLPKIYKQNQEDELGHTGSGCLIKTTNGIEKMNRRNPDFCSVFRSELIAIYEALKSIRNTNYQDIWILTDSRSAIQHLSHTGELRDKVSRNIIGYLQKLSKTSKIHLQWIPSHVGIEGNEAADVLAKKGTKEPLPQKNKLTFKEIETVAKTKINKNWRIPPKHSWYSGVNPGGALNIRNRQHQTTLTRFRTSHLKPLKIENNNKIYPTFPKCSLSPAAPEHILACIRCTKQDLWERPLLIIKQLEEHELMEFVCEALKSLDVALKYLEKRTEPEMLASYNTINSLRTMLMREEALKFVQASRFHQNDTTLRHSLVISQQQHPSRVLATIGVTRGFGDHDLKAQNSDVDIKPFLSSQPEVKVYDLVADPPSSNDVLVMGTDGLWDVTSNQKVAEVVFKALEHFPAEDNQRFKYRYISAAQDLVMSSRGKLRERNWKTSDNKLATIDDISVFVIPLLPYLQEYLQWSQQKAPTKIKDLQQNWISFKNTIIKAAKVSIPRGNIKKWIPNYSHQAKDIQTLITKRNELQKKCTQNQTNCRTELNIVNAKIKRLYVNMKREKWKQTCENLNPRNPNTKLWHLAKQIDRAQPQTENTNMIKNTDGTPATNDKNAANLLGNSYQISSKIKFEIKDKKVEKKARKIIHDCKNFTSTHNIFHEKINMKELDYALENTDLNKTPGPDGIHGQMISNLGKNGKEILLDIFNNSWKTGKLPQDWKTATIIPIKKLDKSADDPKKLSTYLPHNKHIEEVIRKGRDRLKILKYISGREWGADATTLKLTYTSLIRPILEYGYQIYGTASETNLKSLERIQLSAARIITGLRNTCPNDIVLYEADIMPLKDRRSYNLPKYINKIMSYGNKHRTSNYILNWESNLRLKKEEYLKQLSLEIINNIPKNAITIYTDGSRDELGHTGSGCLIKTTNGIEKMNRRNPDFCSVFRSELIAIYEALKSIRNTNYQDIWILTDSRSAIQHLSHTGELRDKVSRNIIGYLQKLSKTSKIHLQWIPSHVGIEGNEAADVLAKKGTKEPLPQKNKLTFKEIETVAKKKKNKNWRIPPKHSWYSGVNPGGALNIRNRKHQTTLTRFRTGHLKPLKIENNNKIYPTCPKCSLSPAAPEHILACIRCTKQDLWERPLLIIKQLKEHELMEFEMIDLITSITRDVQNQMITITKRHRSKLNYWVKRYNFPESCNTVDNPDIKGIINLSSETLTPSENRLLSLGLKFRLPKTPDIPRIISCLEPAIKSLSHQDTFKIRQAVTSILQKPVPHTKESKGLYQNIKKLKQNTSIVITRSDKGSDILI
ncbi:PPM1J [Cordylochernes scorpioides]|uniref:PPM1J n=1 Tax=Cordylochernes scorpioides TaxID=51811 RepID=A0ABY6LE83_9ARAC|nr:PPM1J [Cordylochernes scorpioides]